MNNQSQNILIESGEEVKLLLVDKDREGKYKPVFMTKFTAKEDLYKEPTFLFENLVELAYYCDFNYHYDYVQLFMTVNNITRIYDIGARHKEPFGMYGNGYDSIEYFFNFVEETTRKPDTIIKDSQKSKAKKAEKAPAKSSKKATTETSKKSTAKTTKKSTATTSKKTTASSKKSTSESSKKATAKSSKKSTAATSKKTTAKSGKKTTTSSGKKSTAKSKKTTKK